MRSHPPAIVPMCFAALLPLLAGACQRSPGGAADAGHWQAFEPAPATPTAASPLPDVHVRADEAGNGVRLRVGQGLRVHLPASLVAGQAWELDSALPSLLSIESDPGFAPLMPGHAGRSDGLQTWHLRALHPGRAWLRFVHRHGLDAGGGVARRAGFLVEVVETPGGSLPAGSGAAGERVR